MWVELTILFVGHGNNERFDYFLINENNWIDINSIPQHINCDNLSVVVDACYSVNWIYEFRHESLNGLFTSDLQNSTTRYRVRYTVYEDGNVEFKRIDCYARYFLTALISKQNYAEANTTAINIMNSFNF